MSSEFGDIRDEDILRQMWQETDDFGRKKEIRTHMYKLREARLREFYIKEMESKSPITSRHEDAMADHSFEGFKSNEIRGVDNPLSDIKFGPISGNTGGWNVISSSETSDGGKARTEKMLATTEGVTAIDGGKKAFSGKNEELKTERYDGDANNFTYSTGESSNMSLSENIVMGDENNKRIENKSSTVSHSSKVVRSSANSGDVMIQDDFQKPVREHDLRSSSVNSEHSSTTKSHVEQKNATSTSDNVKLSQDSSTVKEAFRLSNEPGRIISRHVERANPSTNMVIEKKELADGTIVTTKRYETVNSDRINHVDLQPASRDSRSSSVSSTHKSDTKTHQDSINKTSQNVETTFKTSRDEEAFRLSQQPGKILSRDVELKDPTTKMITEKKELHDGTIVTTKRYEKIDSSSTNVHDNQSTKNFKSDIKSTTEENRKTSTNETFKTSRDEEAFRLAQQPGKIIFRDVQMANPTTRMITEKKELTDGTVVTTKRYESVDSGSQSTKSFTKEQKSDNFSKNLRSDSSTTSKTEEVRKTTQNVDQKTAENVNQTSQKFDQQTFKTARDEEAFRLAQQPGKIISREVEMANPTTKRITEKKELTDGTIVTTKRYETIDSDTQSVKSFKEENNSDDFSKNLRNESTTTRNVKETFKTARDEEAFRLSQQPGKIISRDVEMSNPTTRMITEKKELTDGTIVTTKRFETVDSDTQSVKSFREENTSDNFTKNLRNDSTTTRNVKETFKTARDEEAFRLAQQPGKIISREVEITNPTTKRITEKKELTDGTIVTTKRYETIDSDTQSVKSFKEENTSDNFTKNLRNDSTTTRNVKETSKTPRDDAPARLSDQPAKVISRNVEMTNPTTRTTTEKKELHDGTIVTTKRIETIDSDTKSVKSFREENTFDNFAKNLRSDSTTTRNVKETSKAPRDDAPARLSDQPAKVISRNVEMTNPTTRTTTEKKELHDGTIVTTKRIETIDSDTKSVKSFREENTFDNFAKNLRKDSTTTKKEDIRKVDKTYDTSKSPNQTFKTPRDEEAFRLAQQPGKVLSRDVEMTNATTRMITEKKELTDGTIVTTKRFENVNEPNEPAAKNVPRDNVEPRNVRKTFTDSNAFDTDDKNTEREIVEETVTRKVFDTSCKCPEDHKPNNREFINKERNDDHYDMTSEIISNVDNRRQTKKQNLTEVEKNREELMTREEARRVEQRRIEEQIKRQEQKRITKDLEVDSAHRAFASSLRCVTPPNERVATPNVPRMDYRTTRSPSHETTTSKVSTSTVTLRKSSIDRPSPRPLSSEQPSKPNKKTTPESRKPTTQTVETIEIDTRNKKRPVSPQKVVQPRTTSPNKLPQKSQPKKLFTDDSPKILRETSQQKQQKPKGSVTRDVPSKSRPSSNESSPRATSPQKSSPNSGSASPRGVSPQKYPTSSRDSSPSKPYVETTRTTKRKDSDDELMTTTITIDNKDTKFRDDLRITQTVDSKNISATTSVSDLEFISANDRRLLTDLDSEDNLQIKIDVANLKDDDLKIKTTIREVDRKSPSKPDDNDKKIFQRRETFEERASKLIGVTPESPSRDVPSYLKPTFSSLPATDRNVTEVVGRKTKDNQEIERTQRKSVTTESEDFITREKNETRRTTHTYSSPDQSPTRNYSKPTTPKDETRRPTHTYSSPDQSPTRSYSKPTTPKDETRRPTHTYSPPDQSPTRSYSKPTTPKDETRRPTHTYSSPDQSPTRNYSKPTTPKDETRRPTHTYSSPDQSPTRSYSKPTSQKPSESKKPYERPNEKGDLTNVPDTKTTKPSTTRTSSPDKKKPSSVDSPTRTSQRFVNETKTTRRVTTEDEDRSPVRPESQTPAGKPSRVVTNKTSKTFIETTRTSKASPTNRLVKRPTDISTTDQDSDVETEENLIKNIDKSTSKTTRKKLIQGRKDSAPVTRTTTRSDKEKVSRSNTDTVIRTDTTTSSKKTSNIQARKDSVRPSKVITTKTTNVNTINSNTLDDVLIDIQQAKSSREASPNKMIPTPVHPDEDINGDQMIYPDKVTEPDDFKRQAPKVKNIPIFEEKTKKFVGIEITEVGTDQSRIILEEEEHEDREVINSSILERADRKRNSIQIDPIDDEDDDDDHTHLLSVSQKVHKFIETAEELKKPKTSAPFKSDDVKLEDVSEPEDDSRLTVNRKVTKFSTTNDELSSKELKSRKTIRETVTTSYDEVDENLRDDECLLSVTDKVNKFITSAEKLVSSSPQKSPELVKNIMKTSTKSSRSNDEDINESFLTREKVSTLSRGDRSDSKSTVKSENSDITLKSTEAIKRARAVFETNTASRDVKRHDDIMSRPSVFDAKRTPTSDRKSYTETATTRSTTSREKSPSRERHSPYKDYDSKSPSPSSPRRGSSERTPAYMRDQVSTKKELFEKRISSSRLENDMSHQKSISPQHSVNERSYRSESEERHQRTRKVSSDKHYMSHTVASLEHVNTERRDSELERTSRHESNSGSRRDSVTRTPTKFHRNISESTNDSAAMESPRTPTKFGVELKRTDSGKHVQTRKVSAGGETINVEEIFDLDELERLLEIVVGYEQRRRIRAQIRLVRKIISEREMNNEIKTSTKTTRARNASPSRKETTTKVSQRFVESPEKIPRERIEKIVTTTTTTRISGSDKPRDVVTTKSTKVFDKGSAPRSVIENLNKTGKVKSENVVKTTRKNSATSSALKTNTTRESRVDGVDSVTSSYGVGPTDSNGLPLFGLKALKKKTPTTTKESKTTGSTYTEVSYSENGRPATVERKTTRYSTDPSDFDNKLDSDYKKGERKGSRGGMYSVTKTEKFVDDGTTPSSKVIRRGSVKELKEKFVRKDSSSKVTESSSSKKETKRSSVDHRDSESENETYRISRQYRSSSRDSKTFLNSEKKASNVQEVMSYMKNADRVRVDGDTKEDAESRALLNKFLGASALMTSIENNSGLSKEFLSTGGKTAKNQRTPSGSKVTKTVTSYSTAKSYDINDIWDADLLRKLLEATTNYEDRRKIRARLRQVMADKEACAEVVNQLTTELEGESIAVESSEEKKEEGESLLLPLIQGILQNPKYQNLSARQLLSLNLSKTIAQKSGLLPSCSKMNSEHNQFNDGHRLGNDYLPIEDSGTESGEDLRLLAAGLQSSFSNMEAAAELSKDSLEQEQVEGGSCKAKNDSLAAGLLMEVTTALARLQISINKGEIELEESKKTSLLSLVDRLQRGLISPEKIVDSNTETGTSGGLLGQSSLEGVQDVGSDRRSSCGGVNRFAKRRNRVNRHTVGVTREELADARRIIEELELIGIHNEATTNQNLINNKPKITATVVNSKPGVYNAILTRQISEPITLLRPSHFVPKETSKVGDVLNKPKYKLFKQSISLDQPTSILKNSANTETTSKIEDQQPMPLFKKFSLQRNLSGSNNKFAINNHKDEDDEPTDESSSSDDEDEVINTKFYNHNAAGAKFKAKENYLKNQQTEERSFNYSSGDETSASGPRVSKYTSKKMKMKRANTIDLPKSFSFVNTFYLSDKECSDSETTTRSSYHNRGMTNAGLRTTITGGVAANNLPPKFTPKTENDKKFLAFIQKQTTEITPTYVNPSTTRTSQKTPNWRNKFGNLKHKFEQEDPQPKPIKAPAVNAAANFWKNVEKEKPSAKVSPMPPVAPQPFVKSLPIVSDKFPWKNNANERKIDEVKPTTKKMLVEKFLPKEQPPVEVHRIIPEPKKLPALKPSNVNNFSHAPMSAFKPPISRKLSNSFKPINMTEDVVRNPLPQFSNGIVKQLAETGYNANGNPAPISRKIILSSPTRSIADQSFVKVTKQPEKVEQAKPVPWAGNTKSDRVLNLAAAKFEQGVPTVHMGAVLPASAPEPVVKYRNNPLYSGTPEKRSSLPPNASYATFDVTFESKPISMINKTVKVVPKEATFVITDFTQPTSVSTYAPAITESITRPKFDRQDSLTNPAQEPLVLTCNRTVYSPHEKPKIMELYEIPTPKSSQLSSDASIASICDDIENELQGLSDTVECKAAVTRVMKGPVAQTAYTQSSELTSLSDQNKENSMMKSLHDSLKKLSQKSPTPEKRQILSKESSSSSIERKVSPYKSPTHSESRLSQDSSNSSIDLKLPPIKIPIPAVPETAYSITYTSPPKIQVKSPSTDPPPHVIFNNVAQVQHTQGLQKARSSHMLAIPKPTDPAIPPPAMYGATPNQVMAKQTKVQSYFGPKRAESLAIRSKAQVTSHVKPMSFNSGSQTSTVSRKISMFTQPVSKPVQPALFSLSRSKTLPSLANVQLLDESNIDDAFEELLSSTNL